MSLLLECGRVLTRLRQYYQIHLGLEQHGMVSDCHI